MSAALPKPARRRAALAWALMIALTIALLLVISLSQRRFRADVAAYNALLAASPPGSSRFDAELQDDPFLLGIRDGDGVRARRRDELRASLFPGRAPVEFPQTLMLDGVRWFDPQRGLIINFRFRGKDGTWDGYGIETLPSTPPFEPPWPVASLERFDPYRRAWVGSFTALSIGPMLWIAFFIASLFRTRGRHILTHAHLAVAWLCFVGWLLNPRYTISLEGILSNDMLFWGGLMLIVSAIAFLLTVARRRVIDPNRCFECGYDLTGNVSGVCPECGTPVLTPPSPRQAERAPA
jgi:hypothetical protein